MNETKHELENGFIWYKNGVFHREGEGVPTIAYYAYGRSDWTFVYAPIR